MSPRFLAALFAAAMAAVYCLPAAAAPGDWVQPPKKLPHVSQGDRTHNLDFLFGALKAAPDDATAKAIEERIWALWTASRSDTTMLLMSRVQTAIEKDDFDLAIKLLDAIIKIKPKYVEAWNRRATIYYMKKDYGRSLADIREVLRREPRHFGALTGLGLIMQDIGDDKQALEVYRRALAIYRRIQRIPDFSRPSYRTLKTRPCRAGFPVRRIRDTSSRLFPRNRAGMFPSDSRASYQRESLAIQGTRSGLRRSRTARMRSRFVMAMMITPLCVAGASSVLRPTPAGEVAHPARPAGRRLAGSDPAR